MATTAPGTARSRRQWRPCRTRYAINENTLRAQYADVIGTQLAHPFDVLFARDMHGRILDALGPIAAFIQQVEAAWFYCHASVITVRRPGEKPETLASFIGR